MMEFIGDPPGAGEHDEPDADEDPLLQPRREPGVGRASGDFRGPRICSGAEARRAAATLHRALGLPEPSEIDAHWAQRRLRRVDYRTGEKPVVN